MSYGFLNKVTIEGLNNSVGFDGAFAVLNNGHIVDVNVLEPTVVLYVDKDGNGVGDEEIQHSDWEPVTGYSGQYGYSGPCMHVSEFLGGRMARDVLEGVGNIYVVTTVECIPDWDDATEDEKMEAGDNPAGWMLLKYKPTA